jgi:hypothetical protein
MEKKDILKKSYEYLMSVGKVHKRQDIADAMKAPKENISKAFNGKEGYLTDNFLTRFNSAFDNIFNESWLLEGKDPMLRAGDSSPTTPTTTSSIEIPMSVWNVIEMQARSLEKRDNQIEELIQLLKEQKGNVGGARGAAPMAALG